jgi:hypothetical protein
MHIFRTEVTQAAAPTGQTTMRVLFCGEGGECVTVYMANLDGILGNNEAAVERAKALLVQIAAFNLARNDYEAQSNGNFDEVAITAASSENGRAYILEYCDGEASRWVPPSRTLSFEAVRSEAVRCAMDQLINLQPGPENLSGWSVRVKDVNGDCYCERRAGGGGRSGYKPVTRYTRWSSRYDASLRTSYALVLFFSRAVRRSILP